jgi:hypothetical protein
MLFIVGLVASIVLAAPRTAEGQGTETIQLVIRVFDGSDDVTGSTRVNVFPAGQRQSALGPLSAQGGELSISVAPGLYDVQVLRTRNGQISGIKWAERLLVIRYPDEPGEHLQVVNLKPGFGALQIRLSGAAVLPESFSATAHPAGDPSQVAGEPIRTPGYLLFVLPAGQYDVQVRSAGAATWLRDVEVPLDRTRLKQVSPEP